MSLPFMNVPENEVENISAVEAIVPDNSTLGSLVIHITAYTIITCCAAPFALGPGQTSSNMSVTLIIILNSALFCVHFALRPFTILMFESFMKNVFMKKLTIDTVVTCVNINITVRVVFGGIK